MTHQRLRVENVAQRELPGEWEAKLLEHQLEYRGKPSASALARKAGVSVTAVLRVIFRQGSDPETITQVGAALGDLEWVARWYGIGTPHQYQAPAEAQFLDDEEAEVVNKLIRLLVRGRLGVGDVGSTRQKMIEGTGGDTAEAEPVPDRRGAIRGKLGAGEDPGGDVQDPEELEDLAAGERNGEGL